MPGLRYCALGGFHRFEGVGLLQRQVLKVDTVLKVQRQKPLNSRLPEPGPLAPEVESEILDRKSVV